MGVIEVVLALTKLFFKNTNIAKSLASTIQKTSNSRDMGECTLTPDGGFFFNCEMSIRGEKTGKRLQTGIVGAIAQLAWGKSFTLLG